LFIVFLLLYVKLLFTIWLILDSMLELCNLAFVCPSNCGLGILIDITEIIPYLISLPLTFTFLNFCLLVDELSFNKLLINIVNPFLKPDI